MEELHGKTAVVTGAGSGIGRALALRCAAEDMNVVLADVEDDALRAATQSVTERGGNAIGVHTDVSQPDALVELASRALDAFGAVHLLCNNAGVFAAGGTVWETPLEDLEWQLGVNVYGIIHGLRAFVPIMLEQDVEAHIVNTISMAAVTTGPLASGYYASKHAALSFSETLYLELTQRGSKIGVSVLCPELVATRIGDAERNRPQALARKDDGDPHPDRDLVQNAIRELTQTGVPPAVLADRALEAVRSNRFYVLSPKGSGWRNACDTRLEDIRTERNPTFVPTTTND